MQTKGEGGLPQTQEENTIQYSTNLFVRQPCILQPFGRRVTRRALCFECVLVPSLPSTQTSGPEGMRYNKTKQVPGGLGYHLPWIELPGKKPQKKERVIAQGRYLHCRLSCRARALFLECGRQICTRGSSPCVSLWHDLGPLGTQRGQRIC